jgi:hypothetical protein
LISSRRATEMFQFTRCPPPCLCVQQGVSRHHSGWVAPFGYSGLIACLQLPLNVSPVSASFIGFERQGIHLVLSLACSSHSSIRLAGAIVCPLLCSLGFSFAFSAKLKYSYLFDCSSAVGLPPTTEEWKPVHACLRCCSYVTSRAHETFLYRPGIGDLV